MYFTFDGHGSTRVLTDLVGAIVELYSFDAYGNAIGFAPSVALTEFLYSGEQFDSKIGQQYLRVRYYDPATGRFNRLNPFFGNLNDPQTLHKYLYTHADPVNSVDPSGNMSMAMSIGIGITIGALSGGTSLGILSAVNGGNTRTNISYTLKGTMYGGLLGATIAFSIPTHRVTDVLVSGFLSGAANAICSFLTSDNGNLALFVFAGIQNRPLNWTPVGMAFLDGLTWGAAAESFGFEEVIPNQKTDIYIVK